jgi:hypothetical protein
MLLDKTEALEPRVYYTSSSVLPTSYSSLTVREPLSWKEWVCAEKLRQVFKFSPWSKVQLFAYDHPGKYRVRVELHRTIETDFSGQELELHYIKIPDVFGDEDIVLDESLECRVKALLKKGHKVIYVECEYEKAGEKAES